MGLFVRAPESYDERDVQRHIEDAIRELNSTTDEPVEIESCDVQVWE
jgi:hypothetical protein